MNFVRIFSGKTIAPTVLGFVVLLLLAACRNENSVGNEAASTNLVMFTTANFEAEALAASQPVLVDFWATWCGPCRKMGPIVSELADEFAGKVKVGKVDVDAQPELARKYGISAIPTLLIFKGGQKVDAVIGLCSKEELQEKLAKLTAARP